MAKPIKKLYIPDSIPSDYNFMIMSADGSYYDLYNTKYIENGQNVKFYRFYYNNDDDMYQNYDRTNNTGNRLSVGSEIRVELTNNFIYRRDFPNILFCSFIYIVIFVFIINITTSMIRKGGVLGGLV